MKKCLGYFNPPTNHPYSNYTKEDWVMYFIERYGSIDGSHHKTWVLDQVVRILKGTTVDVQLSKWTITDDTDVTEFPYVNKEEGTVGEYSCSTNDYTSQAYDQWVTEMLGAYDEENEVYEYDYDTGIAP